MSTRLEQQREQREWLRDELPSLVQAEVLDRTAVDRLRAHYALDALPEASERGNVRKVVLALLGCLLVGAGVILLFAHNWDELTRPMRAAVSLGQLAIVQGLAGYALFRRPDSRAFLEGTGALLALSVGAAIALIAQTYNLGGRLGDFLLVWIALSLPLLYVLRADSIATLVLLASPWLAFERAHDFDHGFFYLAIIAAVVPALRLSVRAADASGLVLLARWAFVITVPIGCGGLLVERVDGSGAILLFYAGLAGCFIALGARLEHTNDARALRRAFSIVGSLGALGLLLVLSFEQAVEDVLHSAPSGDAWVMIAGHALSFLTLAGAAALSPAVFREGERVGLSVLISLTLLVLLYVGLRAGMSTDAMALSVSLIMLLLGGALFTLGIRERSAGASNQGLGVLAVLFVARFFDTEWSFVARGVGFLLLGLAFLAVNIMLGRKKESAS